MRAPRFLTPMTATLLTSHRVTHPYGLAGGEDRQPGLNRLIRSDGREEILNGNDTRQVGAGDMVIVETPGGGGYGAA